MKSSNLDLLSEFSKAVSEVTIASSKNKAAKDNYDNMIKFQKIITDQVTGIEQNNESYASFRKFCLQMDVPKELLPDLVLKNHTLTQLDSCIKREIKTYKERREFIWNLFKPLLNYLENFKYIPKTTSAIGNQTEAALRIIDSPHLQELWNKAVARISSDPEGTITVSRSILESTCKHILDKMKLSYDDKMDLPDLYKLTAKSLNLSPDQHTEKIFKQILSGVGSVVHGFGSLRNKLSDSHGVGINKSKPSIRHARLALNLGMSVSIFLMETYENTFKN